MNYFDTKTNRIVFSNSKKESYIEIPEALINEQYLKVVGGKVAINTEAKQAIEAKEALRTQLLAVFDGIPKGILPFYENSIKKCTELFDSGDFAELKETIETTPVLVPALEAVKKELLQALGGVEFSITKEL